MQDTHIYIYSEIGQGGMTAESMRKQIDKADGNIIVHINSPGGEVYEGYTIYNLLRNCGKKIDVVIEGLCASIATLIACAGDRIIMNPTAEFMIHNPMVGIQGDSEDLRKVADQLDNIKKTIIQAYKKKTNKTEEELWAMMDSETFLSAQQAKDFGFVDEVSQSLKIVAYFDITKLKTNKTMDQKILEAIENLGSKISGLLKSKPKNLDATLEDGTKIFIETEDDILVGKAVFKVTPAGNIPLDDGDYTLADLRIITVKGGIIESIADPKAKAEDNVDELKKEIADLKDALNAKTALAENSILEVEKLNKSIIEIQNEFETIRNKVIGSNPNPAPKFIKDDKVGHDYFNSIVNNIKQNKN